MSVVEDPRLALLNVAHLHRCPRRASGAAVRILGLFPDSASLQRHAAAHHANGLDVIAVPVRKWAAILQRTQGGCDELEHLERLGRAYKAREREHEDEFRTNVAEKKTGAVRGTSAASQSTQDGLPPAWKAMQEAPQVSRDAEVRMQKYAVISLLPDVQEENCILQQPAVLIWDAFDSEEAARERIRNHLAVGARDVHLDIVAMYEWLPLTNLDISEIKEEFRDESLSDIMQTRKDEGRQVEHYRTLCAQRGQ